VAKLWRLCRMRHYGLAMERRKRFGVSFIFKSLEQGPTFRSLLPKYPTGDPDYRILKRQRSPCTHYFYIRDEVLGPMALCVGSPLSNHRFHPRSISSIRREGVRFRKDDNGFLWTENSPAGSGRPPQPGSDPPAPGLRDAGAGAEVLQKGSLRRHPLAARVLAPPGGVRPPFHLAAELPDSQDLRALLVSWVYAASQPTRSPRSWGFASTGACAASCTVCGKSSTTAILYGASTARAW